MRLLTLLLAVLIAGLAFLWGGEPVEPGPVLPAGPAETSGRGARQAPEAPPESTGPTTPTAAEPQAVASEREAVRPQKAALDLRLIHAATGEPYAGSLQLWQLGVVEDEVWGAGDRKVHDGEAPEGRLRLSDLDPGTYRAYVWGARFGSTTPPAFELVPHDDGSAQVVEWPVVVAEEEPMWLVVVDQDGAPVPTVLRESSSSWRLRSHGGGGPDWASERRRKDAMGYSFGIGGGIGGGGRRGSSHMRWIELEEEPEGLGLGKLQQDSRRVGRTQTWKLRQPDGEEVSVKVDPRGANRFHAVLPDKKAVAERLVLMDESIRERAERVLSIQVQALALGPERSEAQAWRECSARITLHLAGYQRIKVDWRPASEPIPVLRLLPEAL